MDSMKPSLLSLVLLAILALTLTSCGKSGSAGIDPSPVEKSFASADDAIKAAATKAVNAVKSADYNLAMAELLKLAADPKLTDAQKRAVAEVLDQLKKGADDAGKEATGEAGKAIGDAQKTLGK
jgi:predicted small lipoprotein YifL